MNSLLLLLLALLFHISAMKFCGGGKENQCKMKFMDQRGLTRHRATCKLYKNSEIVALSKRKELTRLSYLQKQQARNRLRDSVMDIVFVSAYVVLSSFKIPGADPYPGASPGSSTNIS